MSVIYFLSAYIPVAFINHPSFIYILIFQNMLLEIFKTGRLKCPIVNTTRLLVGEGMVSVIRFLSAIPVALIHLSYLYCPG